MTYAPLAAEEVILTSLRLDLLNEFDSGMLVLDPKVTKRRSLLYAEHALDAVLARGLSLTDVLGMVRDETEGEDDGTHDHVVLTDAAAEPLPEEFEGLTLGALKRGTALDGLSAMSSAMSMSGSSAVAAESRRRMEAAGRDPRTTAMSEVLPFDEMRELYAEAISCTWNTLVDLLLEEPGSA